MFRASGVNVFNPDIVAAALRARIPALTQAQANGLAWNRGRDLLERAIAAHKDFAFETTLGGDTYPRLLATAANHGAAVYVWYVGLSSPELCLARIRSRVAQGGHDIPAADVRRRYDASRLHLIRLLPRLTELRLFDNSESADPKSGAIPQLVLLLHLRDARKIAPDAITKTPDWAKPIVAAALGTTGR